jgi:gas vesicle protein
MTCYFRQLQEIFKKAGIEVTKENKQEVDKIIHSIVRTKCKNCPDTWKEVKKRITSDEGNFVSKLKEEWSRHAMASK